MADGVCIGARGAADRQHVGGDPVRADREHRDAGTGRVHHRDAGTRQRPREVARQCAAGIGDLDHHALHGGRQHRLATQVEAAASQQGGKGDAGNQGGT